MLTVCRVINGQLRIEPVTSPGQLTDDIIWVDLLEPTEDEREWVDSRFGVTLPEADEVDEIEASARYIMEADRLQIRAYFFLESPTPPSINTTVAFVLTDRMLISVRYEDVAPFRLLVRQIRTGRYTTTNPLELIIRLLETKVDQLADVLERLYGHLESLSGNIFSPEPRDLEDVVLELGERQDVVDKVRLSLMDQERVIAALLRNRRPDALTRVRLRAMLEDGRSLNDHARFMFEKLDFLMDATHGRINTEQNKIIKIFSIAAVVFLPPTMIASIYGMNFEVMPELRWALGYPGALLLMLMSGLAPYLYFRRKGWL